ncbi:hypothetical protein BKA65DRAFT_571650 [Rhexocercosporidium sp. MPI-PUGE-AT-0058]|nr:hypothetical protein BKA65DRAFT_571650 [Rhexocercosporidium sp. MPI-PUGE-AT-0058]
MWKSVLIEEVTDYLEDQEDYVVISFDKKTGIITQQYEYEYSLARFLEYVASLSHFPMAEDDLQGRPYERVFPSLSSLTIDALMLQTGCTGNLNGLGIRLHGKDGEENVTAESVRSESPHTDVDFRDLDAISDLESNSQAWSTYAGTDTSDGVPQPLVQILDGNPTSRDCGENLSGLDALASSAGNIKGHSVQLEPISKKTDGELEKDENVGDGGNPNDNENGGPGTNKAVALAATAHAILLACLWAMENRGWLE